MLVNERVVGGRVASHQFHRGPIFLSFPRIQRQPGQPFQFAGQILKPREGQPRIIIAHGRARAPAAAVREQGRVGARLEMANGIVRGEPPEFDEMIAAAAGAQLRPGLSLFCRGWRTGMG